MPLSQEVRVYVRRLERLVDVLLAARFNGANDLWLFQSELLTLQRDIQHSVSATKKLSQRDKSHHKVLHELRAVRWSARRLGDAYAWIVLGLDRNAIHSLGENARVAVSGQSDHGDVGLMAICEHLANQGWGFPLLHDVTDCLRIGDITFVKPEEDHSRALRTVEVKTKLLGESSADDGGVRQELQVTLLSPQPLPDAPPQTRLVPGMAPGSTDRTESLGSSVAKDRVDRQLERMSKALARQRVKGDGVPVDIPGEAPMVSLVFNSSSDTHWKTLRRLIRNARKDGYASECVDRALLYVAFYNSAGVTETHIKDERLPRDLLSAGILLSEDTARNALIINQIPPQERGTAAQRFLPFYLYAVPRRAIRDFLHGRLTVVVMFNPARIYVALEEAGFIVENRTGLHNLAGDSFVVTTDLLDGQGNRYKADLHGLAWHVTEIVEEFKSIHYVVEAARSMRDAAQATLLAEQTRSMTATSPAPPATQ